MNKGSNKKIIIIIICAVAALALIALLIGVLSRSFGGNEGETFSPVDPNLLEETKDDDFDIMEYEGYTRLNRTVMLENKSNGTALSIDESSYKNYGEGVKLTYEMLNALIAGDYNAYNSLVSEDVGHFEWFSQQQIYDITMSERSKTNMEGKNGSYTEYVIVLEYRIHENNGSYRNNILPDASRPQYIVINNSTGRFQVMDIIDTRG